MDAKKNFEIYTNSSATFTNAMKNCGEDFIKYLKKEKNFTLKMMNFGLKLINI